jgi:hypothetical protein
MTRLYYKPTFSFRKESKLKYIFNETEILFRFSKEKSKE